MSKSSQSKSTSFIDTERNITDRVSEYFIKRGWLVSLETKIRGRIADIVATKDGKITIVEVKGGLGDISRGIEQALRQKNSSDFSYLAIPETRSTNAITISCKALGIGLLLVGNATKAVLAPEKSTVLPSIRRLVFSERKKPRQPIFVKSSLESLFRSKAQILILKLLLLHSSKEFHMNDIARRVGIASSTVAKEMPRLQNMGLVSKRVQSPLVLYKINKKSVIYDEMKRIFLKFEMLDDIISKDLTDKDIKYALIYGSFAKGVESETSDIDLLVIGDIDEDSLIKSVSKAERTSGREINFVLWKENDFLDRVKRNIPLIKEITKTPVIMIIGDKDEFKRTIEKWSG